MDNSTCFTCYFYSNDFLKNQTRPILKLAEASEKFGRGEKIEEFVPSGALEIEKLVLNLKK